MAESNIIQMHDYAGNNQYPVTLASLVYDEDGETVGKKLALLLDWFEWGDEKKTSVKTKYPFWSEKQLSAGGIGEEGGSGEEGIGTITGIKVNGEVWNEPDEFGVLTIPNYPTSLEWADIAGRPTHLSQFTDDVVAGKYLPTSGGTITGNLTINGYLYANSRIVEKNIMEFHHTDGDFVFLANDKYSGKGDGKGLAMYDQTYWHSLIHSGNIGEYKAGDSDMLGGEVADRYMVSIYRTSQDINEMPYSVNRPFILRVGASNPNLPSSLVRYGNLVHFGSYQSDTAFELFGGQNSDILLFRRGDLTTIYQNSWKTIAFTDSDITGNAASATKLQTPRTIWGQSFDGTENVTAPPTMPYVYFANQYSDDIIGYIGKGSASENTIYIAGFKDDARITLFTGAGDAAHSFIFNSTGNVLLGTVVDEGYKLDVRGSTLITSSDGIYGVKIASDGNTIDAYASYSEIANLYINHNTSGNVYIATGGGNVGIGTNNPTAKLQVAGDVNIVGYRLYWGESDYYSIGSESDNSNIPPHLAYRGYNGHRFYNSYGESMRIDEYGRVGIGTESPDELLCVAGNIRLKNTKDYGCYLKFGDYNNCYLYEDYDDHLKIFSRAGILLSTNAGYGVTIDQSLTIGSAVLSWDSVNNALKIEGNVYTTGQMSVGGVGTEVQKVFNIAALSDTATANQPYTKTLTHNLNTYDLAVVVYEVEEITQSDGTTEKLTQVLADVTLADENKVEVYFATRKINKKYRIVIIG